MPKRLIATTILILGCGSATEIPRRMPAALTVTYGDAIGDSTVAVKDDSLLATATIASACASSYAVEAGNVADEIMIVVSDAQQTVQTCMLDSRYRTFRVAVAGAPVGTYPVELDYRSLVGARSSRTVLVRGAVSLR